MVIWLKSAGIGLAAAVVTFFAIQVWKKQKPATYNAVYTVQADITSQLITLGKIADILEERLKAARCDFEMNPGAGNTIVVSLKGLDDTAYIKNTLTSTGRLQFREVYAQTEIIQTIQKALEIEAAKNAALRKEKNVPVNKDSVSKEVSSLLDSMDTNASIMEIERPLKEDLIVFNNYGGASLGSVRGKDTAYVRQLLTHPEAIMLAPSELKYFYGIDPAKKKGDIFGLYPLKMEEYPAPLDNGDLKNASFEINKWGDRDVPVVMLSFTSFGARRWAALTKKSAAQKTPIAIIVDDIVYTAPIAEGELTGGSSQVTGDFSVSEAKAMAEMLNAKPLPATLTIISSSIQKTKAPLNTKALMVPGIAFLLFSALGFFILKTLKAT